MKLLPWAVAISLAGLAVYMISKANSPFYTSEGKFLGVEEKEGLGLDDFVKGAVIVGTAAIGGKLVHNFLPGVPVGVKV